MLFAALGAASPTAALQGVAVVVSPASHTAVMDFCFIDESGSAETLDPSQPSSTPVFALIGLIVPGDKLRSLNWAFLQLKKQFNPSLANVRLSDLIQTEIKGSDLRADLRSGRRDRERRAIGLLDKTVSLVEANGCSIVGRVIAKDPLTPMQDASMYSSASWWVCRTFHANLVERRQDGLVVLDSRAKVKNTPNAVGIATQMYRTGGDPLHRLVEVPVFGHSDSHVALQIVDLIASALVYPAACAAYAMQHSWNQHANPAYLNIRSRFGPQLKKLQYRYYDQNSGNWKGGIHASGATGNLNVTHLFTDPAGGTGQLALGWPATP
jgi:Protein of unknown function (DUF3800)